MKRLLLVAISLAILGMIYWRIDLHKLIQVFQAGNGLWMLVSLSMVVPITLCTAWRLEQLMPPGVTLGMGETNRLILVASALNVVLPSKMGELAKAYFIKQRGYLDSALSLSLVVFEKACDMLSLLFWCALGLIFYPNKDWLFWSLTLSVLLGLSLGLLFLASRQFTQVLFTAGKAIAARSVRAKLEKFRLSWNQMQDYFWNNKAQLWGVTATSVFIWFLHLLQIWFFILALKAWTPFLASLALAPLAILIGLLPLTFAGIGTRDAAILVLYQPFLSPPTAAALGVLCTVRYLLQAIAGLPFLGQYLGPLALTKLQKKRF